MSDDRDLKTADASVTPKEAQQPVAPSVQADALDALEDIDFLLEEIENKIAPLALA